jgi:serine/threonine protein kinase
MMNAQEPDSRSMAPADLSESNPTKETPAEAISLEATVAQDDRSKQQAQAQSRANKTIPRIPNFRIIKKLGEGTYGEVYLAEAENTGYRVAVKFLSHVFGQQWQMLQEEVRQLALLRDDPGIVQIQDANFDAQPPYYIMRYAEGGSLTRKLENGPLPVAEALTIFRRMAEALAYVHAKGVRHCDLKP